MASNSGDFVLRTFFAMQICKITLLSRKLTKKCPQVTEKFTCSQLYVMHFFFQNDDLLGIDKKYVVSNGRPTISTWPLAATTTNFLSGIPA